MGLAILDAPYGKHLIVIMEQGIVRIRDVPLCAYHHIPHGFY
jgi:hypothetical protein